MASEEATAKAALEAPLLSLLEEQKPATVKSETTLKTEAAKAQALNALMSCAMYVGCSTLMVLTNKWLASTLDVQAHVSLVSFIFRVAHKPPPPPPPQISLLLMQNAVAVVLVSLLKLVRIVSYPDFDPKIALKWLPVDMCFVVMLSTSFEAMRFLSVPMITVFKQLANLLTVGGEFYLFGKSVSYGVILAFSVMIFGAVLAAANDLAFSFAGYAWQVSNCFATSGYVLYLKHATQSIDLSKFGMVFYNNLLSLPLLAVIATFHGEPAALVEAHGRGAINLNFFLVNAFAGSLGLLLNLASVWCVSATSATTYAVVGALNKIPSTILGFLWFDTIITRDMGIYISVSLIGGFMYSYEKLKQASK
ncbi:hypothetical protein CTAYLR_006763 [Chrysophaeum taylorii]|uniref:Sugar phosphate transporter domain-containing protein n=1 Tax=Chrysophaeum taylorii TaxID=2483200 RepID=A0AAD7UBY2_9STRA|nr:hypothetical protein CTAYLR_006763 [Chrysophaeum taylorii]